MAQIRCQKVSIGYEKKLIIDRISFEIQQGDYLCIVGENGSGKTTLMKGILGLLPLRSGSISFGDGANAASIGYLPQQTLIQKDFPASVYEVVLSGCLNSMGWKPFYSSREKSLAAGHMKMLGIDRIRNKSFKALSGGQQQRVLLARALCATEKILLLDEPAAGLDPMVTAELYQIIRSLNQRGITIVMISHDIRSAMLNANRILHLNTNAEFFGTVEDYKKSRVGMRFLGNENEKLTVEEGGRTDD
jgi:ABC-type Mn/Zn transport systems, ATPase component